MQQKLLLTPGDVAKMLGISRNKAYELFRRSDFPVLKLGKLLKVSKEALDEWIKKNSEGGVNVNG